MSDASVIESYLSIVSRVPYQRCSGFIEALEDGRSVMEAASLGSLPFPDSAPIDRLASYGLPPPEIGGALRLLYAALRKEEAPEIVWTGPMVPNAASVRATFPVARSLVSEAREHLIIAGYVAHVDLLERLGIRGALLKGVSTTIMIDGVDFNDIPVRTLIAAGATIIDGSPERSSMAKFHAKVIVADRRRALVGSANLTNLGQTRNIELGLLVEGEVPAKIAALLERYVESLRRASSVIPGA